MQAKTRGANAQAKEGLLNKHALQGSGNLKSGVEALRIGGPKHLETKPSKTSIHN